MIDTPTRQIMALLLRKWCDTNVIELSFRHAAASELPRVFERAEGSQARLCNMNPPATAAVPVIKYSRCFENPVLLGSDEMLQGKGFAAA